ncbi:MAG: hypothetical protein NTY42_13725 [Planctomycetota bacterium]|nr:hypothetical protein [Planctomycetota bacterium]
MNQSSARFRWCFFGISRPPGRRKYFDHTRDPVRELSEAYAKLFDKVTTARDVDSLRFAELLRDWTAAKSTDETIVPVEQVLERMVAPIAAAKPVLVVVIDGMSVAVFRELMADVLGHDWVLLAEEGVGLRRALATVPSVTEVSRTSLLTGKLAQGHAPNEKVGFAEHPALLKTCRSGFPPVLFHKASLQETDDSSLAADIRKEIGSAHRKIVGVVVSFNDPSHQEKLGDERQAILDQIKSTQGLGGRVRHKFDAERSRKTVCKAISRAIEAIEKVHPEMGLHLHKSINLGLEVSYSPDVVIDWLF